MILVTKAFASPPRSSLCGCKPHFALFVIKLNIFWKGIEVVITSRTRNAVVDLSAHGFESHPFRQIKTNFCLPDKSSFFSYFQHILGQNKEKYAKSYAAVVIRTAAALFLCPQQRKKSHYFLSFFAQIKNNKNIAS